MKKLFMLLVAILAILVLPSLVLGQETPTGIPLSERDAQCLVNSQPAGWELMNIPQGGGADGAPSATLTVLFVPPQEGPNTIEFDRLNGRSLTVRGGEAGQIQPSTPTEIFGVVLMDNAVEFSQFWSLPEQGVVEPGGDPLEVVGIEFLYGRGSVRVEFYRDGEAVAVVSGAVGPSAARSISFLSLTEMSGMGSSWSPGQLAALGVPVREDGCWTFRLTAEVPQNQVLGVGVGTFQSRLSYLSLVSPVADTPTGTPVPSVVGTIIPTLAPTGVPQGTPTPQYIPICPEGQIPVYDGAGNFLQCLAFAG